MRTSIKAAVLAMALGLASVVSGGTPVQAHQAGAASCSSGALCVYWNSHYSGSRYQFFGTNSSWHSWSIADDDSSSRNNGTSGMRARIWKNTNYGGPGLCVARGVKVPHHSDTAIGNDEGSSNDWQWSC